MTRMATRHFVLAYLLFTVINTGVNAQNPDTGQIQIGTQGNRSDPTEYTFNRNMGTLQQQLPFSAVVFSGVDGSEVPKVDNINVMCENEFSAVAVGYTQLTFTSTPLASTVSGGNVPFRVTSEGRAAVVRCYGVSTTGVCPATTNQNPSPQFCRETSLSAPITITMTPPPVVSVCQPVNVIPTFTTNTYDGTFQVVLSEPVRGAPVTVNCVNTPPASLNYCQQPGASCCTGGNQIAVAQTTVPVGQTTATMTYSITTQGDPFITCVGVTCNAVSSANLPEGYLQFMSASSSDSSSEGLFQVQMPEVKMAPEYLTVYNTSFQSVLYMDLYTNQDVLFQCQASVVNTLEEAQQRVASPNCLFSQNATTITTTTTTTTPPTSTLPPTTAANATAVPTAAPTTTPLPTPPPDPSSPWVTLDSSFTIDPSTKFHVVRTTRELLVIAPVQEIVVTTCCSSTFSGITSSSSSLAVATVTIAQMTPIQNNTGGDTSGQPGSERFVVKPAYREVAPCPCDLTFQACDVSCCCDGDCTDREKQTFSSCIKGRPGGRDPDPDLRSCRSNHFPKEDWFPAMCVQFETNALLGEFYSNTDKLTSVTSTSAKLADQQKSNVYTYRETESRFQDLTVVSAYTDGSNILTISSQGTAGNLPFPQRASSGQCLDSTPVHFLHDSQSTCLRALTQQTCADLTPFSARSYVEASSLYNPACPRSYSVSSTGRSLQDETQRVDIQVNYYCAGDASAYLKASTGRFSDLVQPQTVYSFTSGLESINCTDTCNADPSCLAYNQGLGDSTPNPLPQRCSNDNSFVLPATPSYNAATRVCSNVVLNVKYRFSWAGQTITGLTADVILGDISLASAPGNEVSVSQKFSAVFVHDYSGASNQSDNYQQATAAYQRSGRPGNDFGKPVSTGCSLTNVTTGESLPVDQSEEKQMAVWSPGIDGLCQNAHRRFLTFGDDMQSSCVLHLTIDNINNCTTIKQLVLNHLNVLMPSNVIGRYGYNSPDIDEMWIEILREDPFPAEEQAATTLAPSTTPAATASTNPTSSTPTADNTTQDVPFDPLSLRGGVCQDVASGIHLEVFYAETGRNSRYPLLEIIGAAVRYSVSEWSMSCTGPDAARCQNNSLFTQPFEVSSSVQFTRVSATTPQKRILFYEIHDKEKCDTDTCYRFFDDFDTSICHYDTCWHELFYPLTQGYKGYESVSYTRAFSLVFLIFILAYLAVTKPWK